MKRDILFRGLRSDGKGWVYGGYAMISGKTNIISGRYPVEVIPESVGQFTGLTDKNGKKIFENDKLSDNWVNDLGEIIEDFCVVVWDLERGQWAIENSFKKDGSSYTNLIEYLGHANLEVIGNIHEEVL